MGWDYTHAIHYTAKGAVDRKAELDEMLSWSNEKRSVSVLKSRMVGSTYYAAVREDDLITGEYNVIGVVGLTNVHSHEYYNFGVKLMDETEGPYYYDCPVSILDLLTPEHNDHAKYWRQQCRRRANIMKLSDVKEGQVITFVCPHDTVYHPKGEVINLVKKGVVNRSRKSYKWVEKNGYIRWPSRMIPKEFVIIEDSI